MISLTEFNQNSSKAKESFTYYDLLLKNFHEEKFHLFELSHFRGEFVPIQKWPKPKNYLKLQ